MGALRACYLLIVIPGPSPASLAMEPGIDITAFAVADRSRIRAVGPLRNDETKVGTVPVRK